MKIYELLAEDVQAMQDINRMSVEISDYLNRNPELVKVDSTIKVQDIIKTPFKDTAMEYLRRSVDIKIVNMSKFHTVDWITGAKKRTLSGGAMYSQFMDPQGRVTTSPASDLVQFDRLEHKTGGIGDKVLKTIESGQRLNMELPAEILTRSLEQGTDPEFTKSTRQKDVDYRARMIRSTLAHEFNHAYNNLQGMNLSATRDRVEQNKTRVSMFRDISMLMADLDDARTISQFEKVMGYHQNMPKAVSKLVEVSKEILNQRKLLAANVQYVEFLDKEIEQNTGQKRLHLEQERARIEEFNKKQYKKIQGMINTQTNLKTQIERIRPPADLPTDYMSGPYYSSPTELNSRLQQASLEIAEKIDEFKRMGNQIKNLDIEYQILRAFNEHNITQQFMSTRNNEFLKQFYTGNPFLDSQGELGPNGRENIAGNRIFKQSKEFQEAAWNSAMKNPQFKRLVSIAYKFTDAEIKNPTPLATKASLGMKLRALLTGIPQSEIPKTILPNYPDSVRSLLGQLKNIDSPLYTNFSRIPNKLLADTVELSKRLDTPAALKAMEYGGAVLMTVGAALEIKRGYDQIQALSIMLTPEQRKQEITKIVMKLIAEFGLVFVSAYLGGLLAGTAATAVLPGLGSVATGIVGFIGGAAAGVATLVFAGETVEQIVEKMVDAYYDKNPKAKQMPKPVGEPAYTEELVRIRTLADLGP